jgi:hypothetical protein
MIPMFPWNDMKPRIAIESNGILLEYTFGVKLCFYEKLSFHDFASWRAHGENLYTYHNV